MLRSKLSLIAAVPFIAGTLAVSQPVQAQDAGDVAAGIVSGLVGTAFLFGGRNYCWYDNGWNGPGWYWCGGYAYDYGTGWGGPEGWRGWRWHGGRAPGYRPDGWHGDHHGGGGGDWHGDHHGDGGGWHGGGPGGPGGHHGGPGGPGGGGGGGGGGHHGGG
ncbi:MAG: hypothetical protein P4L80_03530, partial [Xanthobacteraceae bacterium]|nr:hypothetical protein [Xanthobacteraceae bacterium]